MSAFNASLITAAVPNRLSKGFHLDDSGELQKIPGGQLVDGTVENRTLPGLDAFAALLNSMTPAQALSFGICGHDRARILSKATLEKAKPGPLPLVSRTREYFTFRAGPAVLMLDHDPPKDGSEPLSDDALLELLYETCPALRAAPIILSDSASSFIYNGDRQLIGRRGRRVYVIVTDGQDIPRAGAVLFRRLQLAGHGHIEIGRGGQLLERGLVDSAVWQPERLDFAGGAACTTPLNQRRPAPRIFNPLAAPLDTRAALLDLSPAEESKRREIVDALKSEVRPLAEARRQEWIGEQVTVRLKTEAKTAETHPEDAERLRRAYDAASLDRVLLADFELLTAGGETVTVGDLLDDPDRWHGSRFHDPLEPDYGRDNRIAWVNLRAAGRPYIWSHAHGGRRFTLHRARREILWQPGERVAIVLRCLELMILDGGVFDRGGELVRVSVDGEVHSLGQPGVLLTLDRLARWKKWDARKMIWKPCDCPPTVAEGVLAMRGSWGLPKLTSVSTAPTMDPVTGRVIDRDGFDAETGTLLILGDMGNWRGVPARPSKDTLAQAVAKLWRPFKEFPFAGPVDRGVFLAAILTSVIRPMLTTAPGFALTASTPGSGKTLLARCLSWLTGRDAAAMSGAKEEDEVRKRLLALGRSGAPVVLLDNLSGVFGSDSMCAWLTAETFKDRVLGVSQEISVPTRSLLIMTGNNLILRGDLCRRILTCRIEPEMETPWKRAFDFDPAMYVRNHRFELIKAALVILKAAEETPRPADRTASFETWSDTVRRAVIGVGGAGLLDVVDPITAVDRAFERDPESTKLAALIEAWAELFRDEAKTLAEAVEKTESRFSGVLFNDDAAKEQAEREVELAVRLGAAMREIAEERGKLSTKKLGNWIARFEGRRIAGKRFERAGVAHNATKWRVAGWAGELTPPPNIL